MKRLSHAFAAAIEPRKSFVHLFDSEKWVSPDRKSVDTLTFAKIEKKSFGTFSIPKSTDIKSHFEESNPFYPKII